MCVKGKGSTEVVAWWHFPCNVPKNKPIQRAQQFTIWIALLHRPVGNLQRDLISLESHSSPHRPVSSQAPEPPICSPLTSGQENAFTCSSGLSNIVSGQITSVFGSACDPGGIKRLCCFACFRCETCCSQQGACQRSCGCAASLSCSFKIISAAPLRESIQFSRSGLHL